MTYQRSYQKKCYNKGLCIICSAPRVIRMYCKKHRQQHNKHQREYRQRTKQKGVA